MLLGKMKAYTQAVALPDGCTLMKCTNKNKRRENGKKVSVPTSELQFIRIR
jgi:hypothetical protein